jgi:hypothetical protein
LKSAIPSVSTRDDGHADSQNTDPNERLSPGNVVSLPIPVGTIIALPSPSSATGGSSLRAISSNESSGSVEAGGSTSVEPDGANSGPEGGLNIRTLGLDAVRQREELMLNLRAAMARLEEAETAADATDSASNIIPFPGQPGRDARIIPVQFRPVDAMGSTPTDVSEPQLPTGEPNTEKSAGLNPQFARVDPVTEEGLKTTKTNAEAHLHGDSDAATTHGPVRGTSTARRERNMDSRLPSAQFDPTGDGASLPDVSRETPMPETDTHETPGLAPGGTNWSPASTSPWNAVNLSSDITASGSVETAGRVEQISKLMGREAVLFRQHTSDSMAMVLRPDAHTELFLHLSRRDGQVEASVRCERGDFHQLNALWAQLQESLAHQKVRLNPLLGSSADSLAHQHSNEFNSSGRDESSRQSRPDNDYMDEWPAPASRDQEPAHVRSRRESGHRLSTSRPGWETWA